MIYGFFTRLRDFVGFKVSIKALDMVTDHGLVFDSFRDTKIKILKIAFQKIRSAKLLNFHQRLCKFLQ